VVALAAVDHKQHIQGLAELASVLGDDENIKQIKACKTAEELLGVFWNTSRASDS
jgi:mannitol/fructose-specific phosphotransferase system IIA component (Ntr-type)